MKNIIRDIYYFITLELFYINAFKKIKYFNLILDFL